MRWVKPEPPKKGDIRCKTWFALLPVTICKETRWMEWVTVEMEWVWVPLEICYGEYCWVHKGFVDKPQPVVEDVHTRKVELDDE